MFLLHLLLLTSNILFASFQEVVYYSSKEAALSLKAPDLSQVNFVKPSHTLDAASDRFEIFKTSNSDSKVVKRDTDPVFHGHPKTREEMWAQAFLQQKSALNQVPSLIRLLHMLASKHLSECVPVILYDSILESHEGLLLQVLMKNFPLAYIHGKIGKDNKISESRILNALADQCVSYIVFMEDVMRSAEVLGLQAISKVVVVARSSQWRVQEFLYSKASRYFVNLLVIAQSFRDDDTLETPFILYTHSLFIDGLGSSRPEVLTSWARGKLARPQVPLFPPKMAGGYAGHRFTVVAANQPPFVFKRVSTDNLGNRKVSWEGIEYRLLMLLGHRNNFSIEIKEPKDLSVGPGIAVGNEVAAGNADIGIGGLYITPEAIAGMDMSMSHSQDCAVFISLTSTALPRYRAIMGPFHWTVWVALTFTYLFGIIPLAFSDKHTLKHLIHNSGEIENMFWYVFGTFTNCFTFVGKNSWSKTTKITTRLLIGWYWIFTIIITACYTGSIIAFVTLPVYPATVDSVRQLLSGNFRVGTLDRGGWERWFANSSDRYTSKLLKHLEFVPNIESGLMNTTKAFFWSYAFLGSKYQLEYVVQSNFTMESSKRSVLHISNECFVPFGVSVAFPKESVYTERLSRGILWMLQSGIVAKVESDVKWDMQRSSTGRLLQASASGSLRTATAEERGLSLSDTQGMFLLLAAGCLAAGGALLSEWLGGCGRMCRGRRERAPPSASSRATTIDSTESCIAPTPNSKPRTDDSADEITARKTPDSSKIEIATVNSAYGDLLQVNVDEYDDSSVEPIDDYECASVNSDELKVMTGHNLQVCADVAAHVLIGEVTTHTGKSHGHSRRSSYVDWDRELNRMDAEVDPVFECGKCEVDPDNERDGKGNNEVMILLNDDGADIDELKTIQLFGEKVMPIENGDTEILIKKEPDNDEQCS